LLAEGQHVSGISALRSYGVLQGMPGLREDLFPKHEKLGFMQKAMAAMTPRGSGVRD